MRFAMIDTVAGKVVNVIELESAEGWEVQEGIIIIQSDTAGIGYIYADGALTPPEVIEPEESPADKAFKARMLRDNLLKTFYDPGLSMALRALRMASTPQEESYANGKIAELDEYAELLLHIPEQPDFPQTIIWPVAPTR